VALYPEARYSLCGTTAVIPDSVGKLARKMGVPVVVLLCHGHHINSPFWNLRDRGVKGTEAEMRCILTPEELKTLSVDAINERIREALQIARDHGLEFSFQTVNLEEAHPNTAVIYLVGRSGRTARVRGASVGGGNIMISNIDGYQVELTGQYPALITIHHDCPGVITRVTQILAHAAVNIAFMRVSRQNRGETAMMIMELDEEPAATVIEECQQADNVEYAFAIPAI
jgi:predicted amino acid-binding ACT domain protein